jgi:hypothetical protein
MAPQRIENIESAPGNGSVSEASKPQDVVHGRGAHRALRLTKGAGLGSYEAKFSASQPLGIAHNREIISEMSPPEQRSLRDRLSLIDRRAAVSPEGACSVAIRGVGYRTTSRSSR